MFQILATVSLEFCYRKEIWGYARVIHKKKDKKVKKNRPVSRILKTMGTQMPV
jgi:hypothetical protein